MDKRGDNLLHLDKKARQGVGVDPSLVFDVVDDVHRPVHELAEFVARRRAIDIVLELLFDLSSQNVLGPSTIVELYFQMAVPSLGRMPSWGNNPTRKLLCLLYFSDCLFCWVFFCLI